MDTARIYHDSEGNEKTIHQMVKCEPEWAANRIQAGEDAEKDLRVLFKEMSLRLFTHGGITCFQETPEIMKRLRPIFMKED